MTRPGRTGARPLAYRAARAAALTLLNPVGLLCTIASIVGFFGGQSSLLDLASNFRMWYVAALAPITAAALVLRSRQLAALAGFALILNLIVMLPLFYPLGWAGSRPEQPTQGAQYLSVLQLNVLTSNPHRRATVRNVESSGADLIALQEVNDAWLSELRGGAPSYFIAAEAPRDDNFGIALLIRKSSSLEAISAETTALCDGRASRPAIESVIEWYETELDLLVLHAMPPTGLAAAELRDAELLAASEWAAGRRRPALVVGDLNATLWSAPFRQLLNLGNLRTSERGFGYQGTWRAEWPSLLRIPIDHVLHSPDLAVRNRCVGPIPGSDHRSVLVVLSLRADQGR